MKAKPLKGQRCDYNESHHRRYFLEHNVKEAVQWLKNKIKKMEKDGHVLPRRNLLMVVDMAFEDVTKNSSENNKRGSQ